MRLPKILTLMFIAGCSGDVSAHHSGLVDGERCGLDDECNSGICAPVMPHVDLRGICFGPGLEQCVRVLVDTWAHAACVEVGMAVALCGPDVPQDVRDRCIKQPVPASQYPYTCCETTLFE